MPISLLTLLLASLPVQGQITEDLEPLDKIVTSAMETVGATAGSLAIYDGKTPLVIRTYGWANKGKTRPVTPTSTFRLASNTKPFTSAAVIRLTRTTDLRGDTKVVPLLMGPPLSIEPLGGALGDPRLGDITVDHLLQHEGGWDRDATYDPMYRLEMIRKKTRPRPHLAGRHVVEYMLSQPLQFTPGEKSVYSNLGYVMLGRVVEAKTGQPYEDAVNELIAMPLGIQDLRVSHLLPNRRHVSEVDYVGEDKRQMWPRDSSGALTCSPPSLCLFMNEYWISGRPRNGFTRSSYFHYGSLPNTTMAWMVQRRDGVNWAMMFNSRRNDSFLEDLEAVHGKVDAVIDASGRDESAQ